MLYRINQFNFEGAVNRHKFLVLGGGGGGCSCGTGCIFFIRPHTLVQIQAYMDSKWTVISTEHYKTKCLILASVLMSSTC